MPETNTLCACVMDGLHTGLMNRLFLYSSFIYLFIYLFIHLFIHVFIFFYFCIYFYVLFVSLVCYLLPSAVVDDSIWRHPLPVLKSPFQPMGSDFRAFPQPIGACGIFKGLNRGTFEIKQAGSKARGSRFKHNSPRNSINSASCLVHLYLFITSTPVKSSLKDRVFKKTNLCMYVATNANSTVSF